jgi:hypothetical protein
MRVLSFSIDAAKNSRKRRAARSPAAAAVHSAPAYVERDTRS